MNRRTVITASLGLAVGLPGCLDRAGSTNLGTTPVTEPTSTGSTNATGTPEPTTEASSTSDEPATTATPAPTTTTSQPATTPELNRTPYPVAWQWDIPRFPLGESEPRTALLTIDEWQDKINEAALSAETRSFLSETGFGSNTVVAFQTNVSAGLNRLILHSVEGVGTSTITLTVEEWQSGSGVNNAPLHLLLVRVPNRGTEPEEAVVRAPSGMGTLTSNG